MMTKMGSVGVLGLILLFAVPSENVQAQGDPKAGAKIFKSLKCAACHAKDGKGQGPAARAMKIKAADWTDKAAMSKMKDQYLKDIVVKGGKAMKMSKRMPGYSKKLKPGQIDDLLAYVRSLAK